jgi:hypothetical protein
MTARLKRNKDLLQILAKSPPHVRNQLIESGKRDLIDCLSECCKNILKGNAHLSPRSKAKLRPFKQHLRFVVKKKPSLKSKKKTFQSGGFLGTLLGIALPIIANLLGLGK